MDDTTINLLKLLPLALICIGVAVIVFRGTRRKPDDSNNRGGDFNSHGGGGID